MGDGPRSILGWALFPLLPALLARWHYATVNLGGADPREWGDEGWLFLAGPWVGYGFLAGVWSALRGREIARPTRRWRRPLASPWVGVGVGPWAGFLVAYALFLAVARAEEMLDARGIDLLPDPRWGNALLVGLLILAGYGWLAFAAWPLIAARRAGRLRPAIGRGLVTAAAFVGSLVGGFWAITTAWRDYFFDRTPLPAVLLAALAVAAGGGCGAQLTAGQARRRSLFEAMLTVWVIGLAFGWRRRGRRRSRD